MSVFVETAIESVRSHASPRSHEDYRLLLERIEIEAQNAAKESRRSAHARAWELARQQGVEPMCNIEDLPRDPSPDEDSVDEFLSWIYSIRRQDNDRSSLE